MTRLIKTLVYHRPGNLHGSYAFGEDRPGGGILAGSAKFSSIELQTATTAKTHNLDAPQPKSLLQVDSTVFG